jgi:hypothetical protein
LGHELEANERLEALDRGIDPLDIASRAIDRGIGLDDGLDLGP